MGEFDDRDVSEHKQPNVTLQFKAFAPPVVPFLIFRPNNRTILVSPLVVHQLDRRNFRLKEPPIDRHSETVLDG